MLSITRHRRALGWAGGLVAAVAIAAGGATTVLAEGPACTVDGRAISQEEAQADPSLCPNGGAPAEETPPAPAPAPDPAPQPEPTPPAADPAPAQPEPGAEDPGAEPPAAETPAAVDPGTPAPPAETPTDAAPTDTPTSGPDATQPAADGTTPPTEDGGTKEPSPATPTKPKPTTAAPGDTTHGEGGETRPRPTRPATPAQREAQRVIRAKLYQPAFRDARLFREHYTPTGRIPEQPRFEAEQVQRYADAAKGTTTHWSTLAALAWGEEGHDLDLPTLRRITNFLATAPGDDEAKLTAFLARTGKADEAHETQLLADFMRALGRKALSDGLDDAGVRERLQAEVLRDKRISIYEGGQGDVELGIIDPRILVTLRFLAERFDTVGVSSMVSGHGVYTSGGNVSLHAYGQAVDIASLDGETIMASTQGKNGKTWHAVRDLLLLPETFQPKELISLWEMGGASFALADHDDHIHVGFDTEHAPSETGHDEH